MWTVRRQIDLEHRPRPVLTTLLGGLMVAALVGCQSPGSTGGPAVPSAGGKAGAPVADPSVGDADEFLVVDCLLPARIRRLGSQLTYLAPRRAIRTSGTDCAIRGGEYVAYDRANYQTALVVWRAVAEEGDAEAQNYVGEIYEKGPTGTPDHQAAAHWYRLAAEQGHAPAQINLGQLYEQGLGVPRDPVIALNWYRRASGFEQAGLTFVVSSDVAGELEGLREEVAISTGESERLREEIGALQRELSDLQASRRAATASPAPASPGQATLASHGAADAALDERQLALEQQRIAVGRAQDELERSRVAFAAERERLATEQDEVEAERERLVATQGRIEAERRRLDIERREIEAERVRLQASDASAREALDRRESTLAEAQAALDAEQIAAGEREAGLQRLEQQLRVQEQALAGREAELAARESDTRAQQHALAEREAALQARERETEARASGVAMQQAALEDAAHRIEADSAELERLDREIAARQERVDALAAELEALEADREVALAGPDVILLDPQLPASRGFPVVSTRSGVEVQPLAGRVEAPAGLLTLMLNDRPLAFDGELRFADGVPVRPGGTEVHIAAIDRQGKRDDVEFVVRRESDTLPAAAVEPAARPSPAMVSPVDLGSFHALVIGNDVHASLPDLDTAVSDAEAIADVLSTKYGFQVTLLRNASRYQILSALNRLRAELTSDDNLLIYYAGHGELDTVNMRGHWLPVDAESDSSSNWISNIDITDILNVMSARRVLVVADSCYSGSLTRSALARLDAGATAEQQRAWLRAVAGKRSRIALTSGGLAPTLDGGGGGHSVFAKALLEALTESDGLLEGQRLHREVALRVSRAARRFQFEQVPQYAPIKYAGHEAGEFFFVPI